MGLGGLGVGELLLILVIALLIFGTKRLKTIGSDLGTAIRGFRDAMADRDAKEAEPESTVSEPSAVKSVGDGEPASTNPVGAVDGVRDRTKA